MNKVQAAYNVAREAYEGQTNTIGENLLEHLIRAMIRVREVGGGDFECACVLLSHVLANTEGYGPSIDSIVGERGLTVLEALTRRPGEPYETFVARIKINPTARLIWKCQDEDVLEDSALDRLDDGYRDLIVTGLRKELEWLAA